MPGKKRRFRRRTRYKPSRPRTVKQFFAMSPRSQDEWTRTTHVVSRMRDGASLRQASREVGLHPRTVVRLAGSALRRRADGRYVARPGDRLLRVMRMPTRTGLRALGLRDSRQASQLGKHGAALDWYFETGDASRLKEFKGKYITDVNGRRIPFLTDLEQLDRLGNAGVLSFETIYARA